MKWISVKDKLPPTPGIIVAILGSRQECGGDPIEDARIVMLRSFHSKDAQWYTMDSTEWVFLPKDERNWDETIEYWIPWQQFIFPDSMITKE